MGVLCLSLFCYALLCVHFSLAIILKRMKKLVDLLLLSYICIVTKCSLAPPRVAVGWSAVCDHTHFFIVNSSNITLHTSHFMVHTE